MIIDANLISGILFGIAIGCFVGSSVSYKCGAWDAYYFAREPGHPGGRKAGRLLYRTMRHHYPDIPNPDEPAPTSESPEVLRIFEGVDLANGKSTTVRWTVDGRGAIHILDSGTRDHPDPTHANRGGVPLVKDEPNFPAKNGQRPGCEFMPGTMDEIGMLNVPCKVRGEWLYIPHADGNWVTAAKLVPFSLAILAHKYPGAMLNASTPTREGKS